MSITVEQTPLQKVRSLIAKAYHLTRPLQQKDPPREYLNNILELAMIYLAKIDHQGGEKLQQQTTEWLDHHQRSAITKRKCPDCGGQLLEGPHGGQSINLKCSLCGHKFNYCGLLGTHRI